jgi:hypothetical protein
MGIGNLEWILNLFLLGDMLTWYGGKEDRFFCLLGTQTIVTNNLLTVAQASKSIADVCSICLLLVKMWSWGNNFKQLSEKLVGSPTMAPIIGSIVDRLG